MMALVSPEQFQFKGYVCKHGFGGVIPKPRAFTSGARDLASIHHSASPACAITGRKSTTINLRRF